MTAAHEQPTRTVKGNDLDGSMTLVGESGGLSSVYEVDGSSLVMGCVVVTTEHGPLYLDPECEYEILTVDAAPAVAATASADLEVHGLDDQPTTCPRCGVRTTFDEHPDGSQTHTCPNTDCGHTFKGVFDPEDFDANGNFIGGEDDEEPAGPRPTTVIATYRPQAWVNDYAIDVDGAYDFDVTDQIVAMGQDAALAITDYSDKADMLWEQAVTAKQVPDRDGPFEVTVAEAIHQFYGKDTDEFYGMGG